MAAAWRCTVGGILASWAVAAALRPTPLLTTALLCPLQLPACAPLQYVCTGAEWHRFPSAFFLPGPSYRLQFIKSGFNGLLPRPFDPEQVRHRVQGRPGVGPGSEAAWSGG